MRFLPLLLGASLLLGACAGSMNTGATSLPLISEHFCEAMRWQDYPTAAQFLEAPLRAQFLEQFQEDKDLHIVESRVQSVNLELDDGRAQVAYLFEYYRLPSTRIERWTWQQEWRRQPGKFAKQVDWRIENPPPPLPWQH